MPGLRLSRGLSALQDGRVRVAMLTHVLWVAALACHGLACREEPVPALHGEGEDETWVLRDSVLTQPRPDADRPLWTSPRSKSDPGEQSVLFVPIDDAIDLVHDPLRHVLYVSTVRGDVLRYSLEQQEVTWTWMLYGATLAIDLSPSGNTLLVAENSLDVAVPPELWIHRIDLVSMESHQLVFPPSSRDGAFSVAFVDDDFAIVSPRGAVGGPLLRISLNDEQVEPLQNVGSDTVLTASPDHSVIGYYNSGPALRRRVGRYLTAEGTSLEAALDDRESTVTLAINPKSDQYAVLQQHTLLLLDATLQPSRTITVAGMGPVGVAYSPVADLLCVAWVPRDSTGRGAPLEAYTASSGRRIAALETHERAYSSGRLGFSARRMKISQDGKWLFAVEDEGIVVYALSP